MSSKFQPDANKNTKCHSCTVHERPFSRTNRMTNIISEQILLRCTNAQTGEFLYHVKQAAPSAASLKRAIEPLPKAQRREKPPEMTTELPDVVMEHDSPSKASPSRRSSSSSLPPPHPSTCASNYQKKNVQLCFILILLYFFLQLRLSLIHFFHILTHKKNLG